MLQSYNGILQATEECNLNDSEGVPLHERRPLREFVVLSLFAEFLNDGILMMDISGSQELWSGRG